MNVEEIVSLVDDDGKLKRKWINKCINAKKENLVCNLTFEEFCNLVYDAGIKSSQIGFSTKDKYVLARYNDDGNYDLGNCRFISHKENMHERKLTDKSRMSSHNNAVKMNEKNKLLLKENPESFSKAISDGIRNSDLYKRRKEESLEKKLIKDSMKDKRYCGEHNSQYGTFWITNGIQNKKWKNSKGIIPEGFYKGRV